MAFSVTPSATVPTPHEACDEATVVPARAANDEGAVAVSNGGRPTGRDRHGRLLEGEVEILEIVAECANLDDTLERVASVVERIVANAVCWIVLFDAEGRHVCRVAAPSLPRVFRRRLQDVETTSGRGTCSAPAQNDNPADIADVMADRALAALRELGLTASLGAGLSAPISGPKGETLGVLAACCRKPHAHHADDQCVIDAMARLTRIAVEHDRRMNALRSADARFESLAASVPGVVYQRRVTPDGDIRYTYISDGVQDLFGVSREEVLSDPQALFDCHGPTYRANFRERLLAATKALTMWDVEAEIITRDGQRKSTHAIARPQPQPDGSVLWDGIILDATRIKQAEEALSDNREMLRAVINAVPAKIDAKDLDSRYVFINDRQAEILGFPADEAIGKTADQLLGRKQGAHARTLDRRVIESGEAIPYFEEQDAGADGRPQRWLTTKVPLKDERRQVRNVVSVSLDITDYKRIKRKRKLLERQLHQAQKMEAVGQLTGGVAHDFNNLLAVVRGNLELLQEELGDEAELYELVREAIGAADRGATLTQRLLAFSRKQALQPRLTSTNELVSGMLDLLRRTLGETIEVEATLADDVWPVVVDPGQLESALLNLAVNARDAMPKGGLLTVKTRNTTFDAAFAADHEEIEAGPYVMLAVSDTGLGMPRSVLERVFEPFFTTKDVGQGSGLGLSMVYGFVKQSKGHVEIESRLGRGTTVTIFLPGARNAENGVVAEASKANEHHGRGETILVVEDAPDVRRYTARLLTRLGYTPLQASDGKAALAILDETPDIDLLFTDVVLPGGMSGVDLAREVHRRKPDLKVLYASGYTENAIVHDGRVDEGVELIEKPYGKTDLARKLRDVLRGKEITQ